MYQFQLTGEALNSYYDMVEKLKQKAMKEGRLSPNDIVVRPLRPEDVGLSNPEWTFNLASANAWATNMLNTTISNNRWIGINGFLVEESGAQAGTQVKLKVMGIDRRYWTIQGVNMLQDSTIFFLDPLTVDENTNITMDIYGTDIDADFRLVVLGVVVEKKGILTQ